ncbi:MAG: CDP-6-deoxy-delta-3,4-glucoseen reductase [Lautropia sp.]|nr:CDP-6-deoxy-delta-3,4-glucoseen reductase [Lautropia sp.]
MTYNVTISPSGNQFPVDETSSVLDAALDQGIVLPYGCKDGACGTCKALVLDGSVEQGRHQAAALSTSEITQGYALLCTATARSDLVLEARVVAGAGEIAVRRMPCRVRSLERLAPDVCRIQLQLPFSERLQYLAGQYIDLIFPDGVRRSYSMATAPGTQADVELHIRHLPGGHFTDRVFGCGTRPALREREIFRLEGPFGTFFLREDSERAVVLLASGTGFAPIKAIVERMIALQAAGKFDRPVRLYWGGRRPADLYLDALCRQWAEGELRQFSYIPVLSAAQPDDAWQGRCGLVHRAVMADLPDMSGHEVYACGVPAMVAAAREEFVSRCGLDLADFHADAFTSEADRQAAA